MTPVRVRNERVVGGLPWRNSRTGHGGRQTLLDVAERLTWAVTRRPLVGLPYALIRAA
jgi:hypothetical protein